MSEPRTGPGRTGYVIAAIFALAGIAGAVAGGVVSVRSIMSVSEGLQRFAAPGMSTVELKEAGTYKVYHEHQSVLNGQTFRNEPGTPPGLVLRVTQTSTAADVPVSAAVSETYSIGSAHGSSVWQFTANEPGQYIVSIAPAGEANIEVAPAKYVFAVGHALLPEVFVAIGGIFCSIGGAIVGLLAAGVIALVTYLRRRNAARTAMA